jgi:hypothetical protein
MHTKIEKCLGINPWVNKKQQRNPTHEIIRFTTQTLDTVATLKTK